MRKWCASAVATVVVTVTICGFGIASVAAAATDSVADDAADVIADGAPTRLTAGERRCLVRELAAKTSVAKAVSDAGDLDDVTDTVGGEVLGMIADCAPRVLVRTLTGENLFGDIEIPRSELACFASELGSLDSSVRAAAVADADFEDLPAASQNHVLQLVFDCMPIGAGRAIVNEFSPSDAKSLSAKRAKCVGQGVGDAVGTSGGVAVLTADDPPPALVTSMMNVMATCTPDTLIALFTKTFRQSGLPPKVASCVAKGIVADPELISVIIAAQSSGGNMPPALATLAAKCS